MSLQKRSIDSLFFFFFFLSTNVKKADSAGSETQVLTLQAPVSGTYMFYVKVTPNPKGHIYVYLVREGTNIDSANANDDTANETGNTVKIVQVG